MGVADQIVRMAVAAVRFPISLVSLQAGPAPGAIFYLPNSFPKAISGKISGPSSDISTCFRLIEEAVGSAIPQVAKACGVLAKNDRLDARMIALFVATGRSIGVGPASSGMPVSGNGTSSNSATIGRRSCTLQIGTEDRVACRIIEQIINGLWMAPRFARTLLAAIG